MIVNNNPPPNTINLRDVYPNAHGASSAQAGSAMTPSDMADPSDAAVSSTGRSPLEHALAVGMGGEPVKWWIALVVLLFGGMWLATYFKGNEVFGNIKFSIYNIIAIVILSIAGGAIAKVLMTKWPLPGISTIVLAS